MDRNAIPEAGLVEGESDITDAQPHFIPVPGGIGVLDGSMIGMLVLYGVSGTAATAATLAYHAIALWVPAVWGTTAFIVLQKTKNQPIVLRHPTEELRTC